MSDNLNDNIVFLVDEEGKESPFELVGEKKHNGIEYFAFMPVESDECEYVILKKEKDEDGEDVYVTIDDDDEFEEIAEIFEDELFAEIDLDGIDFDEDDE